MKDRGICGGVGKRREGEFMKIGDLKEGIE